MMVERNRPWLEKSNPRQKNSNVQSSLVLASPPPSYHWKDKISKMNEVVFLSRCWCTFHERIHIFNLRAWSLSPKIKTITLFIACLYKTYHYLVCRSQQMYTFVCLLKFYFNRPWTPWILVLWETFAVLPITNSYFPA